MEIFFGGANCTLSGFDALIQQFDVEPWMMFYILYLFMLIYT